MSDGGGVDSTTALVDFARSLQGCDSVDTVLQRLSDACRDLLPVTGVGVLLAEDGDLTVATTNSPEGELVERLEAELGQGPCVQALRSGAVVVERDLREAADRYPDFVPRALESGVQSIHALPLSGRGEMVGAVDIVHREPLDLPAGDVAIAQMLADVAVSYIFAVRLHEKSSRLASQLQRALDTRVVIEQAKGMLAERHGEPVSKAFERLRRHARSTNASVRDVAARVIEGSLKL
ncbi:MAG TPA: GAF and ANTAR domain-containing protein [Acidimicrobiales bacterium]|nr:GAF and ANTAR domain-containing protein [Acidimicrobiales bacterium]